MNAKSYKKLSLRRKRKSLADAFCFTKQKYEEQRLAFIKEQLRQKSQEHKYPKVIRRSPAPVPSKESNLILPLYFPLRSSYRTFIIGKRGELVKHHYRCTSKQSSTPESYMKALGPMLEQCDATMNLPSPVQPVKHQHKLLKRYSSHMDWTLDALAKHSNLDYPIFNAMMDYLVEEKRETEQVVRETVKDFKSQLR